MKRHHPNPEHHPHSGPIGHPNTGAAPHASHHRGGFSRPEAFPQSSSGFVSEAEYHQFYTKVPNLEAQWQWDREREKPQNNMNRYSSPRAAFHEGQGGEAARSYYHRQKPESKHFDAQSNMEQRFEESTVPSALVGIERRMKDELLNLSKEQYESEDVEIKRHKDKIMEINSRFHEKVVALRSKMTAQREEMLLKEAQLRGSQIEQMGIRGINQIEQIGIRGDSQTEQMGVRGANQTEQMGIRGSNQIEQMGVRGSNQIEQIGVRGSNQIEQMGVRGSNQIEQMGVRGSNQIEQMGIRGGTQIHQMGYEYDSYRDRMDFSGRSEVRASFPDGRGYGDVGGRYY